MSGAARWRWLVVLVLALSPWPLGGRLPWVSMALATVTIVAAVVYTVPRLWRREPLHWVGAYGPMVGFLVWVGAQWGAGLSVYPNMTSYQWVRFLSYAAFFVLCVELSRSRRFVERVLAVQIGVAFAVALFALVQFFTWNGLLFWVYQPPYEGVRFGPFNNDNYFPAYMVPALAPALALLWSRARRELDPWLGSVVAVGGLSILMARSRAGAVALAVMVLSVALLATLAQRREARDWVKPAVALGITVVLLVTAVFGLGHGEEVFSELETIANPGQQASFVARVHLWRTTLTMAAERPLTGFGLGTFGWILMPYRTDVTTNFAMHAHNEYLEVLVETGVPGLLLVLGFLGLLLLQAWRRLRAATGRWQPGVRVGALAAWLGVLSFATLDFPSVIPATDYLLAFLAAVAVGDLAGPAARHRVSSAREKRRRPPKRSSRAGFGRRGRPAFSREPAEPSPPPETEPPPAAGESGPGTTPAWHVGKPHPLDEPGGDEDDGNDAT